MVIGCRILGWLKKSDTIKALGGYMRIGKEDHRGGLGVQAMKPDALTLIPCNYTMEGENKLSSDLHLHTPAVTCMYVHTHK